MCLITTETSLDLGIQFNVNAIINKRVINPGPSNCLDVRQFQICIHVLHLYIDRCVFTVLCNMTYICISSNKYFLVIVKYALVQFKFKCSAHTEQTARGLKLSGQSLVQMQLVMGWIS